MQQQVVAQQVLIMADLESIGPYGPEIDLPARSLQQQFARQIPVPGGLRRKEDQQRIVLTAAGEDTPEVPADIDALRRDPATSPVISPLISTSLRQSMLPRTVPRSTMPVSETTCHR